MENGAVAQVFLMNFYARKLVLSNYTQGQPYRTGSRKIVFNFSGAIFLKSDK